MNNLRVVLFLIHMCLILSGTEELIAQNTLTQDSLISAFRKGRWLSGLSGSISSSTNNFGNSAEKRSINEFGINIFTGKFIKDQWLIGGSIITERDNATGDVDRTTESLYFGPFLSWYFSRNPRGSMYGSVSSGYVRYKEQTSLVVMETEVAQSSDGDGLGAIFSLGYAYVIHDMIAFDIGIDYRVLWVGVDLEQTPFGTSRSENITIKNTAFTFGFNVILDEFLF
ncbi:hypothetical protein [Robertkochia flava]|uniref:hypothetical protein n=1 Tax=Robertkochia flava TaxID=3447986 RepID=UPI001CCC5196|nr:hypothetical protein [Robertkochia marina]